MLAKSSDTLTAPGRRVVTVPLTKLISGRDCSPVIDARGGDPDEGVAELANLIEANDCRLIQMPMGKPVGGDMLGVFVGNRRLRALQRLAAAGKIKLDEPVDIVECDIDDGTALEMSLAENMHRLPAHPVDQFQTFLRLIGDGMSVDAIATRWCMKPRIVQQRLALGKLSPKLLNALRGNKLTLEAAQAFTIAPDHSAQDRVFNSMMKKWGQCIPANVRRELAKGVDSAGLLEFVGREAYAAAGGTVQSDLFEGAQYPENLELLNKMADEKVAAAREQLASEWGFVADAEHNEIGITPHLWTIKDVRPKYEPKQVGRLQELKDAMKGPQDTFSDKYRKLAREESEIKAAGKVAGYTPEHKKNLGVWMEFDRNRGQLRVQYGIERPEAGKKSRAGSSAGSSSGPAKKRDPHEISQQLTMELGQQLTKALEKVVGGDAQLALCAMIASFMAGGYDTPLMVRHDGPGEFANARSPKDDDAFSKAFAMVLKKKPAERLAILAQIAGAAVKVDAIDDGDYGNPERDALLKRCDAKHLREAVKTAFDVERYFSSVNKEQALEAIATAVGDAEAQRLAGKPKGDIVKAAVAKVTATKWLPRELRHPHYDGPVEKAPKSGKKAPTKKKR